MGERVDILVVGAGPAGSTAARVAALEGVRVLLVERRPVIGQPVQCAEYVPAQITRYVPIPERCIAQRIQALYTHLPDGQEVKTAAPGYVVDRVLLDKALAVAACRAGAEIWTAARAVDWERGPGRVTRVKVQRGARTEIVECTVVIGADGPSSTVGRWIGQSHTEFVDALQVEVVLPDAQPFTHIYFDPLFRGGYGWLFPKGETANVGVGVNRRLGGNPRQALDHLLSRWPIERSAIVGNTGGRIPVGGAVARIRVDNVLLVGDAAGHTHPITGAGIFAAVVGGTLAGQAAARAIRTGRMDALQDYENEWEAWMGGPLRHALMKRRYLDQHWETDPSTLTAVLRRCWIAFQEYGWKEPTPL